MSANPPLMLSSVPPKMFVFAELVIVALSTRSPCRTSSPSSPSIEPVNVASISKVSTPAPPLRIAVVATVTLKLSIAVLPCSVAKPLKFNVSAPSE